jgi:hypothetical protein
MIIFYIVGWCLGLSAVTQKGKIGYFIRVLIEKIKYSFINKPLLLCPECMSSFWGTIIYFLLGGEFSIIFPLSIMSCAFLNGLLWKLYGYLSRMNKQFDELDELKNSNF